MPTNILQSIFEAGKGNALQACVASALELSSLENVPNFLEDERGYLAAMNDFLELRNLAFLKVPLNSGELPFPLPVGTICLVAGKSPRGDHKHVVVSCVDEGSQLTSTKLSLQHDPFPEGEGLVGNAEWAGFFVAREPGKSQHSTPSAESTEVSNEI